MSKTAILATVGIAATELPLGAFMAIDKNSNIIYASRAFSDLSGYDIAVLESSHLSLLIDGHSRTHAKEFPNNDTRGPATPKDLKRKDGTSVLCSIPAKTYPIPKTFGGGYLRVASVMPVHSLTKEKS